MEVLERNIFKKEILKRLEEDVDQLRELFEQNSQRVGTRFVAIDNLLPTEMVQEIFHAFELKEGAWRLFDTFRERKYTSKSFDEFNPILKEITYALQDPEVVKVMGSITGIKSLEGDPSLYAGGLSMMQKSHFLDPHIDNSHDAKRELYRRLNVLYYVTPEWEKENGGHLELWSKDLSERELIESRFNRLVLMETNNYSWHSVSKVLGGSKRCCVSNYLFSETSPLGKEYFHITAYSARPEDIYKKYLFKGDNFLRTTLRKVFKLGLGRKDVYQADAN